VGDLLDHIAAAAEGTAAHARILTIDIETAPAIVYAFQPKTEYITPDKVIQPGRVLCFAAKWYGHKDILFHSEPDDGHAGMIEAAHRLLSEADVVVHYNGDRFDLPHLNREFLIAGLPPTSPARSIDLIKTVRSKFLFPYRRLDEVCKALGLPSKVTHQGFGLWRDYLAGDPKAWALMERYNRQDVRITERLYIRLRPWLNGQANLALWAPDGKLACPNCGSQRLKADPDVSTSQTIYGAYQCRSCGTPVRASFIKHRVSTRVAR